jgi:triosephosphate isomerase (TIM)
LKKLIVANWKMNGTVIFAQTLLAPIAQQKPFSLSEVVICPSFPLLHTVHDIIRGSHLHLGAQDCHNESSGAFTGNVSAELLKNIGCDYVIVGHSERRLHHHESNNLIKEKAERAIHHNITPIICIGENLEVRNKGQAVATVIKQLSECLPESRSACIIAYEPIWAIGTGMSATDDNIAEVHKEIRSFVGSDTKILYGGSVNAKNAHSILAIDNVDGVLVGGASLQADTFLEIINH